jgi:hypothetical protein
MWNRYIFPALVCVVFPVIIPLMVCAVLVLSISNATKTEVSDEV